MSIHLKPAELTELRPRITVIGVGGAGGNAVNNMIQAGVEGVEFVAANTDAQALSMSSAGVRIQMGVNLTEGLGAGSKPDIGAAAAEEALDDIRSYLEGVHMLFITAGMGGGTGTGAAPIIARAAKDMGILTVAVVTKPFEFEGQRRMKYAEKGIGELAAHVDTILVIPNQNLFRVANEKTTFADAFQRADDVLRSGVSCITDLMIKEGLINLDFADVKAVMKDMGTAMMGTGESKGDSRALEAAELAVSNPLLDNGSMRGAQGLLISITGSHEHLTLYEVQEAAERVRREVAADNNPDLNIIVGAIFDQTLDDILRVSVVATGIDVDQIADSPHPAPGPRRSAETDSLGDRLRTAHRGETGEAPAAAKGGQVWEGPGSVTIEQRPPRRTAQEKPRGGGSERSHPHFEPVAPTAPRRRPRRPLTDEDFPELSGRDDSDTSEGGERRKGGLFSWMSGRNRSREERGGQSEAQPQEPVSDREEPRMPQPEPARETEEGAAETASENGKKAAKPRINRGSGNGTANAEEPFDIPDFFKRPLN
ncbi:cell division protein FtsZ [Dichotomicrobium thermohalophilum]|uniref:Cell division protein FtsZ n=1 Tax=Dichotomicrobium thermohalophilum TaxID=933063 RepID=A0A397Q5U4_9HYPH|nr:cell division protein FtsZ [Dichotomicrobium thermohalophilum]RIA55829.1 cell division protein FtsZ [Dichotomicrobium thermohalophilum]